MLNVTLQGPRGHVVAGAVLFGLLVSTATLAQDGTGSISGSVLENVENVYGIDVALAAAAGVPIDLVAPDGTVATTSSQNGAYSFAGLAPGGYQLLAHAPNGKIAQSEVPVAAGVDTRVNVVLIARKDAAVFLYSAAIGVDGATHNPDVNVDGIVDTADVEAVEAGFGTEAEGSRLDVNRDGVIDAADVAAVLAAFGKVVVYVGTKYQAQVTPGGSIAVLGEGLAQVRSESGSTTGLVQWAPAVVQVPADPVEPGARRVMGTPLRTAPAPKPAVDKTRVRFTITEDVGVASSEEIGAFDFSENPDDPTWIDVDLATGRVVAGRIGLTLSGGFFANPVDIGGDVGGGVIGFAPSGFSLYHVVDVRGTLPADFPFLAGQAFVMGKCDPPKADKRCQTKAAAAGDTCEWPAPFGGTASCGGLGQVCSSEDAECALGGSCNTCQTQCTRTLGGVLCGCWCLP